MGDNAYSQATAEHATEVDADLGNVESSVTNTSATDVPDLVPMRTLPIGDIVAPVGVKLTDKPQRGAVPLRMPLDIIASVPQEQAPMRAVTKSYATHTPVSVAGLDAAALSVDLGEVWRFVVDHSVNRGVGILGSTLSTNWSPAAGSGDQTNVALEIVQYTDDVDVDFLNAYYSRIGNIIRPSVGLPGCAVSLKAGSAANGRGTYTGASSLFTPSTAEFTVAFVADIDDPPWAFCDLVSTYNAGGLDTIGTPGAATDCCLRLIGDRLIAYAHGRRCFDEIITSITAGPHQPLNIETRRPVIIVWSMDYLGTGSLVVVTPKKKHYADLSFKGSTHWSLHNPANDFFGASLDPVSTGGFAQNQGGFMIGAPNFEVTFLGDTVPQTYMGGAAVWSLYDIAIWDTALDLSDCIAVSTLLDGVYGTSR